MKLDFEKYGDKLIPAIVQDSETRTVLMLGFMNDEAVEKTRRTGRVTFYSRSRQQIWTKGETSGNYLKLISITADCDNDTLLIKAKPVGPVCHTGTATCFGATNELLKNPGNSLYELENIIDDRHSRKPEDSYVSMLFEKGINKIAQKVGEEAVELVIEAMGNSDARFKSEAADLLFHYLVLLRAKEVKINDVIDVLKERRR